MSAAVDLVRRLSTTLSQFSQKKRENWTGRFDFLLSCIGYAVGLGTIWRFPYVCYRNGGGAFLIPYVIYMILLGMPLVILEMGFGQFASLSPISIWKISPLFKGVGVGMVVISALTCIYYNVIIAWTLFYFSQSFRWELPWKSCNNPWNTPLCFTRVADNASDLNATLTKRLLIASSTNGTKWKTASEEFWSHRVLKMSAGIDQPGSPDWELLICLVVAWLFIFLCLSKGIKSSGKVVYVTATLPYVLLLIFIIKGLTMDGAIDGIKFYLLPKWSKLMSFQPWLEAAQQMFYSMGAAWGAWITMASYNKFNNNFYRDAVIVSLVDTLTAFLSGFVIFSTLGYMAKQTKLDISEVVVDGPGLVFIVMPEAISSMPLSPFWAVLFFIFIFFVGVDSQFGMFETVLSSIFDIYPALTRKKYIFTGVLCFLELIVGLACITKGGIYVFQIMDWYCSTFSLMVLSLIECLAISWIYGSTRFYHDMHMMLGRTPSKWWAICWKAITPTLITFIFITNIVTHTPASYGDYTYPTWAIIMGLCLALSSILVIPLMAIIELFKHKGSFVQRLKNATKPTHDWGPADRIRNESYKRKLSGKVAAVIEVSNGDGDVESDGAVPVLKNLSPKDAL
ncbi:hypothetical protein HELRODRAFT_192511 [Helobdella robusta]|uniref:Transporter n=1 Tax=Helobdella robusta TaxID=6412 RepID=T1FU15_HELRO|nr:hypothetical protein HELRODRAFT_192511 [Helobdella robusta]ESO00977.1 hypothetical protein HELRODRAFT_192511 [Helobdella robusta]